MLVTRLLATTAFVNLDEDISLKGATVKLYLVRDGANADFEDAKLAATATKDADADDDYQVKLNGLTADSQKYGVYVTQTVGGEESDPSADAVGDANKPEREHGGRSQVLIDD